MNNSREGKDTLGIHYALFLLKQANPALIKFPDRSYKYQASLAFSRQALSEGETSMADKVTC